VSRQVNHQAHAVLPASRHSQHQGGLLAYSDCFTRIYYSIGREGASSSACLARV